MNIRIVLEECITVKSRDHLRKTVITDIYKHQNGIYKAFSFYTKDKEERALGYGESYNKEEAVLLSRIDLRKTQLTSLVK